MPRKKTISDDDLLKAAREVFVEKGFAAPTRDIARRAGVSEGLLFQRYGTKSDLFFAAMVPPPLSLTERLQTPPGEAGFEQTLRRAALDMLDYFRSAAPILAQLMTHPGFRFDELATRHPQSALVALRGELVRFFAVNKSPDPSGASLVFIFALHGIAMFERLGAHGGRFPDEFVQRTIGSIWTAVRPATQAD